MAEKAVLAKGQISGDFSVIKGGCAAGRAVLAQGQGWIAACEDIGTALTSGF